MTQHARVQLGGKGANLCEMARLGLNVPPGFTVTTAMCEEYQRCDGKLPPGLWQDVLAALKELEEAFGKPFASTDQVRSLTPLHPPQLGLNSTCPCGPYDSIAPTMPSV